MKDKEKEFKERANCGIAYCEDTAVDEIKQDFKMQEEKYRQIEEMAKEIHKALLDCKNASCCNCEFNNDIPMSFCKAEYIAKAISEKYQPKLLEDSIVQPTVQSYSTHEDDLVVLSREELNTIQANFFDSGIKCGSRETAEKILIKILNIREIRKDGILTMQDLTEIAKQFGAEIKE